MDTKAYIASGVIESYVLGLASAEEVAELELLYTQYAEIKNAVDEFEALMEAQAFENAPAPPPVTKGKIMQLLAYEFEKEDNNITPAIAATEVAPLQPSFQRIWRYLAAASIILLIVSTALNFYFYSNYKAMDNKYEALLTERNSLQASNDIFRTKLNGFEESIRVIQNPDVQEINLAGTKGHEDFLAMIYWDSKTKDVYLLPSKLDSLPDDKQYQLWAIVDGKPVSAGLVDDCNGLCRMTNIPRAQMFAITIEQKGGSETPTLEAMVVAGKV